jgi:SPP1 family predicted phage head-tail adaptor
MLAGRMQYVVTIRRRSVVAGDPGGVPRGPFADAFTTRAWIKQENGAKAIEAGVAEDQARVLVRIYDCARNRAINAADRIKIDGQDFSIESVALRDRGRNMIEIIAVRKIGG